MAYLGKFTSLPSSRFGSEGDTATYQQKTGKARSKVWYVLKWGGLWRKVGQIDTGLITDDDVESIAWDTVLKAGSDLADLETKSYNSLTERPVVYTSPVDPDTLDTFGFIDEDDNTVYTAYDTNWDDMRVGSTSVRVPATSGASWEQFGTSGIYTWVFDTGDILYFETQLTHRYEAGTVLRPHIHWAPSSTNTGTCNWQIIYQIQSVSGTFSGTTSSNTGTNMYDDGGGTAYKHQVTPSFDLSGSGITESAVIFGKITRVASGDTFTGDPYFLSLDFHIQTDKAGTPAEYPA